MKTYITIADKKTGQHLGKLSVEQFMKSICAPKTMFVQTAVESYNETNTENIARLVIQIGKKTI